MACTKRPQRSTTTTKRTKQTPSFTDDEVVTCGAEEAHARYAWVHFHGYGEGVLENYLLDDSFQHLLRDFPSVRAHVPIGGESFTYVNGKPTGALEGWGDYLTDNKGLEEDVMCPKTLRKNTEKAHGFLAKLHEKYGKNIFVSGYSMGFGFAAHVLATLPEGIQVSAFLGINGILIKATEPHLTNLPKRCKSFTVQWSTPLPMECTEPSDEGDYFFRQWAQDVTRQRFKTAGLANKVVYEADLPEGHCPSTRCTTMALWLKSVGVVRGVASTQGRKEPDRKRSFGFFKR